MDDYDICYKVKVHQQTFVACNRVDARFLKELLCRSSLRTLCQVTLYDWRIWFTFGISKTNPSVTESPMHATFSLCLSIKAQTKGAKHYYYSIFIHSFTSSWINKSTTFRIISPSKIMGNVPKSVWVVFFLWIQIYFFFAFLPISNQDIQNKELRQGWPEQSEDTAFSWYFLLISCVGK